MIINICRDCGKEYTCNREELSCDDIAEDRGCRCPRCHGIEVGKFIEFLPLPGSSLIGKPNCWDDQQWELFKVGHFRGRLEK